MTFSWLLVHIQYAALLSRCFKQLFEHPCKVWLPWCSKHHWTYKAMKCGHSSEFIDWSFDGVSEGIRGEAGGGSGSIWSWDCYTKVRDESNGGKEWLKKLNDWMKKGWSALHIYVCCHYYETIMKIIDRDCHWPDWKSIILRNHVWEILQAADRQTDWVGGPWAHLQCMLPCISTIAFPQDKDSERKRSMVDESLLSIHPLFISELDLAWIKWRRRGEEKVWADLEDRVLWCSKRVRSSEAAAPAEIVFLGFGCLRGVWEGFFKWCRGSVPEKNWQKEAEIAGRGLQ